MGKQGLTTLKYNLEFVQLIKAPDGVLKGYSKQMVWYTKRKKGWRTKINNQVFVLQLTWRRLQHMVVSKFKMLTCLKTNKYFKRVKLPLSI